MSFSKIMLVATLFSALVFSAVAQGGIISLVPQGSCDGPDGRPKVCGEGLPPCCEGFKCGSCTCRGPRRGTCIGNNISILCAACCQIGQKCTSDAACRQCGSDVKCTAGTCQKESTGGCPPTGCINCEKEKSCRSNSDCSQCGSGYRCQKCPNCAGVTPATGTCKRTRSNLCPVLDCACNKQGNHCQGNSECCPDSEICFKCPPCPRSNFFPKSGTCIPRRFKAIPFASSSFLGGHGIPQCPPCLPDFPFPGGPILP
ncbi:hypothetical protein BSKO_03355 [Bryopsis sp. KO-2023]|nr:hypothetical protein BSKO_03355 [Bryopsis sp. KO-2023]